MNVATTQPLELVCLDFLTLEAAKWGFQHILVIADHFTRYAQAIPSKNMTAKTTVEALFNNFIACYRILHWLHSDQGVNFKSHIQRIVPDNRMPEILEYPIPPYEQRHWLVV